MGVAYFVIAILGCADGSTACTPVMTVPARYATEAGCLAATPGALLKHNDFDFPSLFAECRPSSPRASADREPEPKSEAATRRG